jgi:hypothetical protein
MARQRVIQRDVLPITPSLSAERWRSGAAGSGSDEEVSVLFGYHTLLPVEGSQAVLFTPRTAGELYFSLDALAGIT